MRKRVNRVAGFSNTANKLVRLDFSGFGRSGWARMTSEVLHMFLPILKTLGLFVLTALAEIIGCFLP
jgi:hypothetical protein